MASQVAARLVRFDQEQAKNLSGKGWMIAGVDEAGRGPLAGPVVAAAVIFYQRSLIPGLNDSKKVSWKVRGRLFQEILLRASVGIGVATESEIDDINIYQASRLAMRRAVFDLNRTPDFLLIDGRATLDLPVKQRAVIGGDGRSACIAAASIIAKVYRDAWMTHLDSLYPLYRFAQHKGYPTTEHVQSLRAHGPSPVHRKTFGPVRSLQESIRESVRGGQR